MTPIETHIQPCNKDDIKVIVDGINRFNLQHVKAFAPTWTPLEFSYKTNKGEIVAGILAGLGYWNGLEIKILWVEKSYRGKSIGTKLLHYVEQIAIKKGAKMAMLDTFSFQAEAFYCKNGYTVFGEVPNFPKGHKRLYLHKVLQ